MIDGVTSYLLTPPPPVPPGISALVLDIIPDPFAPPAIVELVLVTVKLQTEIAESVEIRLAH